MIRRYCDCCGTEIEASYAAARLVAERTFRLDHKRTAVKVECIVTINGAANTGDICRDCVIDTVDMADTRPRGIEGSLTGSERNETKVPRQAAR